MERPEWASRSDSQSGSSSGAEGPRRSPQRAPRTTCGAWLMDSVPPARTTRDSPSRTCCAAWMTASKPEPHKRLTVSAGVSIGSPARSPMWRARYGASADVCRTLPKTTWPTSPRSTPARSIAARAATTPRSVAVKSLRAPPKAPNPVRAPARKATPVSRGADMTEKYKSDHGAAHDHPAFGDDHDTVPDVEVGAVQKAGLAVGADPHIVADAGVLVHDGPLDPRAVPDAHRGCAGDGGAV